MIVVFLYLTWKKIQTLYKIISQNKNVLLPTYPIFFQHVIGNRLFFCLALGKFRVIKSVLYAQHTKLVVGKKSGLVELSRASRFSRSLARLASGKFQLVSSPVYYLYVMRRRREDDDINDVATMGGVNLSEESQNILATNSELMTGTLRSCLDENFLYSGPLRSKINAIGG